MTRFRKVIVIGLDGFEPTFVQRLRRAGSLPHLDTLAAKGRMAPIRTTYPAQTPVAWSTFATGRNPGGHGIFDFITRDPDTYLPELALSRYEQKSAFLPPKVVNRRSGTPVWDVLQHAGVPSTVLRCPCTYPPDEMRGRMLSGMGVPDLRGGFGTGTFYTTATDIAAGESERVIRVDAHDGQPLETVLVGPRNPKTGEDATKPLRVIVDRSNGSVSIRTDGKPQSISVRLGEWSPWLRIKFKLGALQSAWGMVRFHLTQTDPFGLYASPVNFDPHAPLFPISAPWDYAGELERAVGTYYTTGMVEDHAGLTNGRFSEASFLDQCEQVMVERERMMLHELDRFDEGLFYCLFDTPDRVQHMFWRFLEGDHPAYDSAAAANWESVIDDHYRRCDATIGKVLPFVNEETLCIVLSDHGFTSFQRGLNLNTWLCDNGFMALKNGARPGDGTEEFFDNVDWAKTKAYAVGLGGIYLNRAGREADGIVENGSAEVVANAIAEGLTGIHDSSRGREAVRSVVLRDHIYRGNRTPEAPDLLVNFAPGYRASWRTPLGGMAGDIFEDNRNRWSGDHVIDPALVPGFLTMNTPFDTDNVGLEDMAPTILTSLGVEPPDDMEGRSVVA